MERLAISATRSPVVSWHRLLRLLRHRYDGCGEFAIADS